MAAREITLSDLAIGSVERFRPTIKKDGVPWNLTLGTVTIKLVRPDGTVSVETSMAPLVPETGVFYYDTDPQDLDMVGYWSASITVTDSANNPPIVKEYPYAIGFYVADH